MLRRTAFFWIASIPIQGMLIALYKQAPEQLSAWYSNYIFLGLLRLKSPLFNSLPFSFGDVAYGSTIVFLCYQLVRSTKNWRQLRWSQLWSVLGVLAAVHFFFLISWGFNYHNPPLSKQNKVSLDYTPEALKTTLATLIEHSNKLHQQLAPSDTTVVQFPFTKKEIRSQFMQQYPQTAGIKNSLWSTGLSYMGFAGYLNPFTGEAQVNAKMPLPSYITTVAHEQAHQLGYAREQEANYLAFVHCIEQKNPYIQYAGYIFGLRYCYNALYQYNVEEARTLKAKIRPGILKEYRQSQEFWEGYENPLEPLFKSSYDSYLKAQWQTAGIRSYSLVVAFIVDHLQKKLMTPNNAN